MIASSIVNCLDAFFPQLRREPGAEYQFFVTIQGDVPFLGQGDVSPSHCSVGHPHGLGGLKGGHVSSPVLGTEGLRAGCRRVLPSVRQPPVPSLRWLRAVCCAPWLLDALPHLCPRVHVTLSLSARLRPGRPSGDTSHAGLGLHPNYSIQSHLKLPVSTGGHAAAQVSGSSTPTVGDAAQRTAPPCHGGVFFHMACFTSGAGRLRCVQAAGLQALCGERSVSERLRPLWPESRGQPG